MPRPRPSLLLAVALGPLALALDAGDGHHAQDEAALHFEAKVRPILVAHCVECHSGERPKGGLALDTVQGIAAGAHGEPIFDAGDLDASLIVEAVRYDDPFVAMPPTGKLPDADIAAIERWIELGAGLPEAMELDPADTLRWCFRAPEAGPGSDLGPGPIDALVDRDLAGPGEPPAEPLDWLRRVTFDLTGLPPTPDEARAYLADAEPGADARVVDRLLASPAYGERQARRWLDLVRYAETKGHEFDFPILNAWEYRDWVIRAFEADVPYDRFVRETLAGDLLARDGRYGPRLDPTGTFDESPLGTAVWQLGEEVHSPVEPRGDQADRMASQVEVLSKSLLALGVSCARCHDHKFDPVSAVDYHAMAGFALGTAPRQLRYETDGHNRDVDRHLRALEEAHDGAARRAVARALRAEAEGLDGALADALAVLESANAARSPHGDEALAELDRRAERRFGEKRYRLPVVIEDFEFEEPGSGSLLGPWTAEGDAFAAGPRTRAELRGPQADAATSLRGTRAVSSYLGHGQGDRATGTLTSRPFVPRRDFLHARVGGGDGAGVRLEVIDGASGEVLGEARGSRSNRLDPVSIDISAYRERALRVRAVDEARGAWGQLVVDHLVLSDHRDPEAETEHPRTVAGWLALLGPETEVPRAEAPGRTLAWAILLDRVRREGGPGRPLLAALEGAPGATEHAGAEPRALVEYGELRGARWITNGPGFGTGPRDEGAVALAAGSGGAPEAVAIATRPSALAHPLWADLEVHDESRTRRGSSVDWVQAGRTLVSPTFRTETGELCHLVRGKGALVAVAAGHKLVNGPLHGAAVRRFDTGGEWRWIRQSFPSAAGQLARIEWTALGAGPLEVARTAERVEGGPLPDPASVQWLRSRHEDDGPERATPSALLRDAAQLIELGGIRGRVASDDERAALLALAEFVAGHVKTARESIAGDLEPVADTLLALRHERRQLSRLAPAALDLEGRDERVLDRGDWKSPGEPAPRAAPAVLRGDADDDAPLSGSGRLDLADALIASPTKILQRVWVNRQWAALFGEGLVATPDDFGAMGALPSSQELLDRLALDFEASGWSTKALLRRLCLTRAYLRRTAPRPLQAEELRDGLLAAAGRLDSARFGPPVQLHLTPFMAGRGRPGVSGPLDGAGRRSIYIEVRRNFPQPFLTTFGLPTPSTCHGVRAKDAVPAHALTLLNDPFVELCAEGLAEATRGMDPAARVDAMSWRALGRPARAAERDAVLALLEGVIGSEGEDPWVDVAHAMFNRTEFRFLR